ncbi:head-tail connector protein [Paracoccus yeei]|uniref:Phage gp6-like head-tail connector protein n=1 Tax=Paracoccus yeei TaxID=147645 RepID=A0A5P2QS82_9RHOB|nr:head-tail connector protein [Paracoccus yeei]QEU08765.1 hypothetical protein FOB51_12605 [Paracoccus yeei]
MRMTLVVPPADLPVSLSEARKQCRVDHDGEDDLITAYVEAAVSHLDGYRGILGRCLITQDWRMDLACLPAVLRLPFPDAVVVAATFTDAAAGAIAWLPHESLAPSVWRASAGWGRPASVIIRAGFGPAAEDVPRALQVAILQVVGHWYDNRAAGDFPGSAEALISPFRMRRI